MTDPTDSVDLTDAFHPLDSVDPPDSIEPTIPRSPHIAGIVLAAGSARRYGSAKQLVEVEGEALVVRAVRAAVGAGLAPVVVVVGRYGEAVEAALDEMEGVRVIYNPAHAEGVSTSIAAGLLALRAAVGKSRDVEDSTLDRIKVDEGGDIMDGDFTDGDFTDDGPPVDGIAFLTCDQPGLDAALIAEVLAAFTPGKGMIVRPIAGSVAGHPVIFDPDYVPELLALTGDIGGTAVIRQHVDALVEVNVGDPSRLRDVDRPAAHLS